MSQASWQYIDKSLEALIDQHLTLTRTLSKQESGDAAWLAWFTQEGIAAAPPSGEAEPIVSSPEQLAALERLTAGREQLKRERAAAQGAIAGAKARLAEQAGLKQAYLEQHRKVRRARVVLSVLTVLVLIYAMFG